MTHTDETALLAAIREAPNDDLPRLIYADWLEERDQPEVALNIRRWVYDLKPAAVRAWGSRRKAPTLKTVANRLLAVGPGWRAGLAGAVGGGASTRGE